MDYILENIKNNTIFENFNFENNIDKLLIDDLDYNIIIDNFEDNKKDKIYIVPIINNKINGYGLLLLNKFILIKGNFKSEEYIEDSKIYINNKLFAETNLINGKLNGYSTIYYDNQIVYKGYIENNIPNDNNCLFTFINNNRYTGSIINGIIEGIGTMQYNIDDKYTGDFINGKKHGKGKLYKSNIIIDGNWFNDKEFGIMKIINKSLVKYKEYNIKGEVIKEYTKEEYLIKTLQEEIEETKKNMKIK